WQRRSTSRAPLPKGRCRPFGEARTGCAWLGSLSSLIDSVCPLQTLPVTRFSGWGTVAGPLRLACDDYPPRSLPTDRTLPEGYSPPRRAPYDVLGAVGKPARCTRVVSTRRTRCRRYFGPSSVFRPRILADRDFRSARRRPFDPARRD